MLRYSLKNNRKINCKLREDNRTNQLYFQQELRKVQTDYQEKLKDQTTKQRVLSSSETDQQREIKERGKLIAKLEEQAKESQKELDFANSKIKQLNPLFSQILAVIKKNVILRGKKDLKETIAQIQELMNWEKSPLVTETNTPTGEETEE